MEKILGISIGISLGACAVRWYVNHEGQRFALFRNPPGKEPGKPGKEPNFQLYVGAKLVQYGKTREDLTLIDQKLIEKTYYYEWWIIHPSGEKEMLYPKPYEIKPVQEPNVFYYFDGKTMSKFHIEDGFGKRVNDSIDIE